MLTLSSFLSKGKGDMTTYWVQGHDAIYLENQKQIAKDSLKNISLISVQETKTSQNNSLIHLTNAYTPNGDVLLTSNAKGIPNGTHQNPAITPSETKETRNSSVAFDDTRDVTNANNITHSIKNKPNGVVKSALKPKIDSNGKNCVHTSGHKDFNTIVTSHDNGTNGGTKANSRKDSVNSDLIQFDGTAPENDALFTPVELSVSGETPIDDIVDELLNDSTSSLRHKPRTCR